MSADSKKEKPAKDYGGRSKKFWFLVYLLIAVVVYFLIGQFVSAGFFTVWNYLWYRFWVFPEKLTKRKVHIRPLAHIPHGHGAYHKAK